MEKIYDGKVRAKMGTDRNPAVVTVQSEERMKELASIFEKNGWTYEVKLDPDGPEDTSNLEILLNPVKTKVSDPKTGRNDPCPCGSGMKYKKCCGK